MKAIEKGKVEGTAIKAKVAEATQASEGITEEAREVSWLAWMQGKLSLKV